MIGFSTLRELRRSLAGGPGYDGTRSDDFDGRHFFNPEAPAGRSFRDLLRWHRTAQRRPWPQWVENRARPALPAHLEAGQLALTFINHIPFLIQLGGLNILTDPVYSARVSPFHRIGPRRVRAPGLPFEHLPRIDLVLVSHNHYDHLDIHTLEQLKAVHDPLFVTGLGNRAFLRQLGLRRIEELDWWQSLELRRATVTMIPAQHWSGRSGGKRNPPPWGGIPVRAARGAVFFSGGTRYWRHLSDHRRPPGIVGPPPLPHRADPAPPVLGPPPPHPA